MDFLNADFFFAEIGRPVNFLVTTEIFSTFPASHGFRSPILTARTGTLG
jgi:hypothetical protein